MDIPKEIAKLILTYSERYFKDSKAVELELEQYQQNDVNKIIENLNDELRGRPSTLKRSLIERKIRDVESGICNIGEYTKWLEETSKTAFDILSKELEDTKDYTPKKTGYKLLQKATHYKFLDYLSMFELGRLNLLKDELEKLKEQIKSGTETITNTGKKIEVPEDLKELLSIWHDKNDIENIISIYNNHKIHFEGKNPQKKLMSCFAHTLFDNGWLIATNEKTHNSTLIAKKFFSLFSWKFNDKDKNLFDYHLELEVFPIQYTSKMNIPKRESK
jgi:hypothetical protein